MTANRQLLREVLRQKTFSQIKAAKARIQATPEAERSVLLAEVLSLAKDSGKLEQACRRRQPDIFPALALFGDPKALRTTLGGLEHKSPVVRARAVYALKYFEPLPTEPLLGALSDPDELVAGIAADGLQLGWGPTLAARVKILARGGGLVAGRATRLLATAKPLEGRGAPAPARSGKAPSPWPKAWRLLSAKGFLDYGNDPAGRVADGRVLWLGDVEWLKPSLVKPRPDGLVPFAQNGAGEVWCFSGSSIAFVDEDGASRADAVDFPAWLHARLLTLFAWNADAAVAERFPAIAACVAPYLSPRKRTQVEKVVRRRPEARRSGEIAILTPSELKAMLQ